MENLSRHKILPPLFREKEESFASIFVVARENDRATDYVSKIMLLELGRVAQRIEEVARIEGVIPAEVKDVAVDFVRARFGLDFNRARAVAAVLCTVVG